MKFTLGFKCADVLDQINNPEPSSDPYIESEWDTFYKNKEEIEKVVNRYIKYGEFVEIEFDSETLSARVL